MQNVSHDSNVSFKYEIQNFVMEQRDNYIDFLRFIGLSLMIMAHVNPPNGLFQLRCFDVPLMVFVSGLCCGSAKIVNYREYIFNRTKRLLIPVWSFLIVYFAAIYLAQEFNFIPAFLTKSKIIESFLLLNGIGYVWIIRVFLLMMIITPLLQKINIILKNDIIFLVFIFWSIFFQEGLMYLINQFPIQQTFFRTLINEYLLYMIGYAIIFIYGIRLRHISNKSNLILLLGAILIFILLLPLYFHYQSLPICFNCYKYPPHLYFISYGLLISCALWYSKSRINRINNCYFEFIGKNTIWIYLWHIPLVALSEMIITNWVIRYIFVYICAVSIFYLQYYITNKYCRNENIIKYLIG